MERSGLDVFNALAPADAQAMLAECCSSTAWARAVSARRPYADRTELYRVADEAVQRLDADGLAEALAGHPRIGERGGGPGQRSSAREQAGVADAEQQVLDAIADGNAAYERRFGHVYLVCATGRSGPELLEILRHRLGNDAEQEEAVTRDELAGINRIRLERLLVSGLDRARDG